MSNDEHKSYSFPLLKNNAVIEYMACVGIDLTEAELTEPHHFKDKVRTVFVTLVEKILNITEQDFKASPTSSCAPPLDPEHYTESFSETRFLLSAMKLMKICDIHDFGWKDLQTPTQRRFRRQISAVINVIRFHEDRHQFFNDLIDQRHELLEGMKEVQNEYVVLVTRMNEAKAIAGDRWKEIKIGEGECAEVDMEISQQNTLQASIRTQSTKLKKRSNKLKESIDMIELQLQELQDRERELSCQLVSSPEKIKHMLTNTEQTLINEKKDMIKVEQEIESKKRNEILLEKSLEQIECAKTKIDSVVSEMDKFDNLTKEVQRVTELMGSNKLKLQDVQQKNEEGERQLARNKEKLSQLQKQSALKLNAIQQAIQKSQKELHVVEKDRSEGAKQIESNEAELKDLEREIEDEKLTIDEDVREMINCFKQFEMAFLKKDDEFITALK